MDGAVIVFGRCPKILESTLQSDLRMTTGFGPFELPTRGLLQKGRDHSPPKFCFVMSSAFWLAQLLLGAFTVIRIFKLLNRLGEG